eukprot:2293861-Prymnesium_polylepis.1
MHVDTGSITISRCNFTNNGWGVAGVQAFNGGGLKLVGVTEATVDDCFFVNNSATNGRAIYVAAAALSSNGSTVDRVGEAASQPYPLRVTRTLFKLNRAHRSGGAIFVNGPQVILSNNTQLVNNEAPNSMGKSLWLALGSVDY